MHRLRVFMRVILFGTVLTCIVLWAWLFRDMPNPAEIESRVAIPTIRIEDRNGRLLYDVVDANAGRNLTLTADQIPQTARDALIATEDRNFYDHPGVDIEGIVRAMWINIRGGEVLAGGSTITQQLARNLLFDEVERQARTVRRKLRESWLAWRLSRLYSKDDILTLYLNQIYFGGRAYGFEAAAQTFFGRSASQLSIAETSLLIGLPQSPAAYNPLVSPDTAKARQEIVIGLMLDEGFLDPIDAEIALAEPLRYASDPYPIHAPHFVQLVQTELDAWLIENPAYQNRPLTVRTTLDLNWQERAEGIVQEQVNRLNDPPDGGFSHRVTNGALIAIDPQTGEILTWVGSADYFNEDIAGAINMGIAPRQPGSTLKPFIYAAGMDPSRPNRMTPATVFYDVSQPFTTRDGESYVPVNFTRTESGPVRMRQALATSLNIPAVAALDQVGLVAGKETLERFGLDMDDDPNAYDLSIVLGGEETTLLDLTEAYGVFANGGLRFEAWSIQSISDAEEGIVFEALPIPKPRIIDERVAWLMTDMLADDRAREEGFGRFSLLNIDRPAAAKTGTTTDFRDNWTVGYTAELVVGVWVGNANYDPMIDVTGLSGAAPIWHRFMRSALDGTRPTDFQRPRGVSQYEICGLSGLLPTELCPNRELEWFIDGTEPVERDTYFVEVSIDRTTGYLATRFSDRTQIDTVVVYDLPPELHGWARDNGLSLKVDLIQPESEPDTPPNLKADPH